MSKVMRGNETLNQITDVLREIGGYFTFTDERGEEVVVTRKRDVAQLSTVRLEPEVQLTLPPSQPETVQSADELLERINRDIALYRNTQEETFDDIAIPEGEKKLEETNPLPPPRRVRFEPLRGDLPPELQE